MAGKKTKSGAVTRCQSCDAGGLIPLLSLGHQPIVQDYLSFAALTEAEATYPLGIAFCKKCTLVQLTYVVDPELVFPKSYPYRTGLTNMLLRNFAQLATTLTSEGYIGKGDLIVDIGSNDGSLLDAFRPFGIKVVGVEPTDAAKDANKRGIRTYQAFFDKAAAAKVRKNHGAARVVTATNVFAHIDDTASLVKNVKTLMDKDSVFVSESQYLMDIVEKLEFDTIYHEHLRFYSLQSLIKLFALHDMSIVDAERITAAGGSIRTYAKLGNHPMSTRAKVILAAEKRAGLHDVKALKRFAEKVIEARNALVALVYACKKKGRIVGITSSARSNTLLGFSHIDASLLDYSGEKTSSPKIGLYTPGTHIPVVDESQILKDQPEYALVLSWHIGKELVAIMKKRGFKGKFIIPLPKAKVVS